MADFDSATTKIIGPVAVKLLGWVGAALGGALLVLLLNTGGQTRQVEIDSQRITKIEAAMDQIQNQYATNKRVDDLQAEVRANYQNLSVKMDNVIKILIERK